MTSAADSSQRKAAKVAGAAYLLTFVLIVTVNFGIHERLMVAGNAAQTASNILTHQRLFRVSIAGDALYSAGLVVLLTALYVILRPVGRGVALFAAFCRLIYALMWIQMTINLFDGLRLLTAAEYLKVFEPERLQAWAKLYFVRSFDVYYLGLLFFGLASAACAYLFFKSRYIPRTLAAFGVIASAWAFLCSLLFFVFPGFTSLVNLWWFDTPLGIFELATGVWLLFKGLTPRPGRPGV